MKRFVLAALMLAGPVGARSEPVLAPDSVVTFDPSEVKGDPKRPDHALIRSRTKSEFASLIRLRTSFARELRDSVDDL